MNLRFWKNALFCCCLFAITACSDEETVAQFENLGELVKNTIFVA